MNLGGCSSWIDQLFVLYRSLELLPRLFAYTPVKIRSRGTHQNTDTTVHSNEVLLSLVCVCSTCVHFYESWGVIIETFRIGSFRMLSLTTIITFSKPLSGKGSVDNKLRFYRHFSRQVCICDPKSQLDLFNVIQWSALYIHEEYLTVDS